ncbi:MAG: sulfurtransferase TusA family protein [Actinomycetales bacterium]|nr:sulfurtransferase TusA family protein [Actinomycetales bacterium]
MPDAAKTVDAKGQSCPMPVLMTAKGIKEVDSGQVILVETTDNGARSDIPAWASQTGNELVGSEESDGVMRFYIKKK